MQHNEAIESAQSADGLVSSLQSTVAQLQLEIERQRAEYDTLVAGLREEIQLLLRKIYGNRTERGSTAETQLAFGDMLAKEQELQRALDEAHQSAEALANGEPQGGGKSDPDAKPRPSGRRNLAESKLPHVEIEVKDRELEGKCPRAGFDVSYQLYKKRAEFAVLVKKVVKYKVETLEGTAELSAKQPPSLFERGVLHTSVVADIINRKFGRGEPLYRQEQEYAASDTGLDRGTMSRYLDEAGNALGATVVTAMWKDAIANAGIISTDATGALIQPEKAGNLRQACRNGHFFTAVVDDTAVIFHYTPRHTQEAVKNLFGEFCGFLQADAHHVYNVLERSMSGKKANLRLVGCWAHCRRYFFEAALCRHIIGVKGLMRIKAIYVLDQAIMKLPRSQRTAQREAQVLPLMREFFLWLQSVKEGIDGLPLPSKSATAVGYALNQEAELLAVLSNPALPLDNTRAERALRKIVTGRKNWMFYGSDCHAEGAAALFSLIATCRLHRIEPVRYLDEVMRVLPVWPKERMLELAPQHWAVTRAKLDEAELALPISHITVPAA